MLRLFRLCALLCLLAAPALAQSPGPRLGLLILNDEWTWRADDQPRLILPAGVVTGEAVLDPAAAAPLTPAQRASLLRDPRRLMASRRTAALIGAEQLLVIGPEVEGRLPAIQLDVATGARLQLQGPRDADREEACLALVEAVLAGTGPVPVPVAANPDSRMYHQPAAPHLSPHAPALPFADRALAEKEGYRPCRICFPETNRLLRQDEFERELGQTAAGVVEQRYRVSQDARSRARLEAVGKRLMDGNRYDDRGYRFVLLDSDELNAFSVPTGPIYVTTALLDVMETEDELAGVLAHELAHAEGHHMVRQNDRDTWVGILGKVVSRATGSYWADRATDFFSGYLSKGFSREFELEADREAVFLTYAAGYRPTDFSLTLVKFRELSEQLGQGGPDWFDTHPAPEARLEQVKELCAKLVPLESSLAVLGEDAELASYLRRKARHYVEDPREIEGFLEAWGALARPAP